jgi:small subunit ribosomal protein S28e
MAQATEKGKEGEQSAAGGKLFDGWLAEIVDIAPGRTGIYGEIKQGMCKVLEGKDKGRVIRRNIAGRMKKGDIIRLPDTSREDKKIVAR